MCIRDRPGPVGSAGGNLRPAGYLPAAGGASQRGRVQALARGYRAAPAGGGDARGFVVMCFNTCLLYTSDAADERSSVDLGGCRIIKKKKIREGMEQSST